MITEAILNILAFIPNLLLDGMGAITLSIPSNIFDGLNSIFSCLGFIFPISGLLVILGISFTIKNFQIIWSIILRIKSFIPRYGGIIKFRGIVTARYLPEIYCLLYKLIHLRGLL